MKYVLKDKAEVFAIRIVKLYRYLQMEKNETVMFAPILVPERSNCLLITVSFFSICRYR